MDIANSGNIQIIISKTGNTCIIAIFGNYETGSKQEVSTGI